MSSSVNTITFTRNNNIGINNNMYQYNFKQGNFRIDEDTEVCVNKAVIPNSIYNITGNNNYFYYTMPIFSPNLSSSTTITGFIQGQFVEITSISNGSVSVGNVASFITSDIFLKSQIEGAAGNVGVYITNAPIVNAIYNKVLLGMVTLSYTNYGTYGNPSTLKPVLNTSTKLSQYISNYTFTRTDDNSADTMPQNTQLLLFTNWTGTVYLDTTYTNVSGWTIEQSKNYYIRLVKGTGGGLNFSQYATTTGNPNLGFCCNALGINFASNNGFNRYAILRRSNVPITKTSTFIFSFYCGGHYFQGNSSLCTVEWFITKHTATGDVVYTGTTFTPSSMAFNIGFSKNSLTFSANNGESIDIYFRCRTGQSGAQDITFYFSKVMIQDLEYDNRLISGTGLTANTELSNTYYGWSSLYALTHTQLPVLSTAYETTPTTSYFSNGTTLIVASAISGVLVGDLVISTTHNALIPYGTYIQSITSSTEFVLANDNVDLFITPFGVGVGTLTAVSFFHPNSYSFGSTIPTSTTSFNTLSQQTAYKVSLDDGYYDVSTLNTALLNAQLNYNTVFSDTSTKSILYPLQLSYNTTLLRSTLTAIFIPTSAGAVVSQIGTNWVWNNGTYPTTSYSGRLWFDTSVASLLGFISNAFSVSSLTAYDSNNPFPRITNSPNVPYYQYVNALVLRCNLVDNKVEATSDIIGTIPFLNPFETNINYNPNKYCWVKIRSGIYSSLVLTLTDQFKNPLTLNDNNVLIQLLIRKI